MSNVITIELCTEDRERLDRIASLLDWLTASGEQKRRAAETRQPKQRKPAAPVETPDETVLDNQDEPPFDVDMPEQASPEAQKIKLADIQQKVVQLSAGGKKAEVREIVKAYAEKVSAIPEDKYNEVMDKLSGLEG